MLKMPILAQGISSSLNMFTKGTATDDDRELAHYQNANRRLAPAAAPGPAVPIAMSSGGKANGLSFEHVMMKLQTELAKSRETGAELQELTGSMGDIQDTLGGGLVSLVNSEANGIEADNSATISKWHCGSTDSSSIPIKFC